MEELFQEYRQKAIEAGVPSAARWTIQEVDIPGLGKRWQVNTGTSGVLDLGSDPTARLRRTAALWGEMVARRRPPQAGQVDL